MVANRARVGKEPVQRDNRRNPGKERHKREECDAAGGGQDPVGRDRPDYPPNDVMPSTGGDLLRRLGLAPSARFTGAFNIGGTTRIFPAANLTAPVVSPFN